MPKLVNVPRGKISLTFFPGWLVGAKVHSVSENRDRLASLMRSLMDVDINNQHEDGTREELAEPIEIKATATAGVEIVLSVSQGHEVQALRLLASILEETHAVDVLSGE